MEKSEAGAFGGQKMKVGMWGFRVFAVFLLIMMVGAEEIRQNRHTERISGGFLWVCFLFPVFELEFWFLLMLELGFYMIYGVWNYLFIYFSGCLGYCNLVAIKVFFLFLKFS